VSASAAAPGQLHTVHGMTGGAGLGLWGMAPAIPQPWQQLQPVGGPYHPAVGTHLMDSSGSGAYSQQQPQQQHYHHHHQQQQPSIQQASGEGLGVSDAGLQSGDAVSGVAHGGGGGADVAPADTQHSSLLVAVLQEITRQQS
jgi:hypothetical protein